MALRYDETDKLCEEAKGQTLTSSSAIFVVDGAIWKIVTGQRYREVA